MLERGLDARLFLVALWWLRQLARWSATAAFATDRLHAAIATFDAGVPHLKDLRDTQEHFDAYGTGVGDRQRLEGEHPEWWRYHAFVGGGGIAYGNMQLDLLTALQHARALHGALRAAVEPHLPPNAEPIFPNP